MSETLLDKLKLIPHWPRLFWHQLFVREDEFHHSLDLDTRAYYAMNRPRRKAYLKNLVKRRKIAHDYDLALTDATSLHQGDVDKARRFLRQRHPHLSNQRPVDLIRRGDGLFVKVWLSRMPVKKPS